MSDVPPNPFEETTESSPLHEADPTSIDKIFESFQQKLSLGLPREITDFEIQSAVDYYLKLRKQFLYDLEHNIKTPRAPSAPKSVSISKLSKEERIAETLKSLDF